jgi:hypothetical protein
MLITVLAPPVLIQKSAEDLGIMRATLKELKEYAKEDGVHWTLSHFVRESGRIGYVNQRA